MAATIVADAPPRGVARRLQKSVSAVTSRSYARWIEAIQAFKEQRMEQRARVRLIGGAACAVLAAAVYLGQEVSIAAQSNGQGQFTFALR
jgi:type VI protein secretion system component VasF